jgi:hypothetical protein
LIPRSFFGHPTRLGANLISIPVVGSMAGMFYLLSIGQGVLEHATALTIGLRYLPFCLSFFVGIGASVPLQRVIPPRTVIATGMLVVTTGMLWLAHTALTEPFRTGLLPASLALAIGYGLTFPPLQVSATADLTNTDTGLGSGVQATAQAIGNAVGVSAFATIADLTSTTPPLAAHGLTTALLALAGTTAFTAAATLLLLKTSHPRSEPTTTPDLADSAPRLTNLGPADSIDVPPSNRHTERPGERLIDRPHG